MNENDELLMYIGLLFFSAFVAIVSVCQYAVNYANGVYDGIWYMTPDGLGIDFLLKTFAIYCGVKWLVSHNKSKD